MESSVIATWTYREAADQHNTSASNACWCRDWESREGDEGLILLSQTVVNLEIESVVEQKMSIKKSKPRPQKIQAIKSLFTESCHGGTLLGEENQAERAIE